MSQRRQRERTPINWADLIEVIVGAAFLIGGLAFVLSRT
jgi:hypothetical protein